MSAGLLNGLLPILMTGSIIFVVCIGKIVLGIRALAKKTTFRPVILLIAFATHLVFSVVTGAGILAWEAHARALERNQCEQRNREAVARGGAKEIFGCDFGGSRSNSFDVGLIAYLGMTTLLTAVLCNFYIARMEGAAREPA